MSYCSVNYLKPKTHIKDVIEFLKFLGYRRNGSWSTEKLGKIDQFGWFDETDYKSVSGVEVSVYNQNGRLRVETRTPISRSYYDLTHQNKTIRELRHRFGGWFRSDVGKNRCMSVSGGPSSPTESGCARAFNRFGHNFITLNLYIQNRDFKNYKKELTEIFWINIYNPWVISNNLLLPFIVAASEDYWKSTYIALLKYSPKKESILKNARLNGIQLTRISEGKLGVEEAYAETLSFQSISAICDHFNRLEQKTDLAAILRKPIRKGSKSSLFIILQEITELRHTLIHRGELIDDLSEQKLMKMVSQLKQAITKYYKALVKANGWNFNPGWTV